MKQIVGQKAITMHMLETKDGDLSSYFEKTNENKFQRYIFEGKTP